MTPLRQQMLDAMAVRGLAARTQEAYVDSLGRMARCFKRSPAKLTAQEFEAYMLHLVKERHLSFSSVNHVAAASRFLFTHVLSQPETGTRMLPRGIKRIRHYGVLANGCKKTQLARARQALGQPTLSKPALQAAQTFMARVAQIDIQRCPQCKTGPLKVVQTLAGLRQLPAPGSGLAVMPSAQARGPRGPRGPP